MKYVRWYDKNPELKEAFEIIEKLDEGYQKTIAQDIIQILMVDFGINLDGKINEIAQSYNYQCKRWYDYNIDLHTSFEIIKDFSPEFQSKVVKRIVESILYIYLEDYRNE